MFVRFQRPKTDDLTSFYMLPVFPNEMCFLHNFVQLHGNHFDHIQLTSCINWTLFPTMHVRPIGASDLNISPLWRTPEACCHPADPWSGQMKGREGEGWRVERKTWAKVKKANLFPASPAVPERQTTHCPCRRGFHVVKGGWIAWCWAHQLLAYSISL